MKRLWDDDELTAEWTLEPDDQSLLANKTGATRLGFAALLTFFRHEGRFPASKHEVPAAVVAHLARQVGVPADLSKSLARTSGHPSSSSSSTRLSGAVPDPTCACKKAAHRWRLVSGAYPGDQPFRPARVRAGGAD